MQNDDRKPRTKVLRYSVEKTDREIPILARQIGKNHDCGEHALLKCSTSYQSFTS